MERMVGDAIAPFSNVGDYADMRAHVDRSFARLERDRHREPADWKPFSESSSSQLDTCRALAAYVVADAAKWQSRPPIITETELQGWRENAGISPDQVQAFGAIATAYCSLVGQRDAGLAMEAYLQDKTEQVWHDEQR